MGTGTNVNGSNDGKERPVTKAYLGGMAAFGRGLNVDSACAVAVVAW